MQKPFWVKKQMLAMWCWAMSATGIASSEPGSFAIQVLWPSRYGSSRGRYRRWSESLSMRSRWRSIMSAGVISSLGRVDQRAGVAGGEVVEPAVVGEEELAGVEPGGRGHRAAGRRAVVVREMRGVAGVPGDPVVPAGGACHGGQDEQRLELAQRHVLVLPSGRRAGRRGCSRPSGSGASGGRRARPGAGSRARPASASSSLGSDGSTRRRPSRTAAAAPRRARGSARAARRRSPCAPGSGSDRLDPRPGHRLRRRAARRDAARRRPPPASRRRARSSRHRRVGSPAAPVTSARIWRSRSPRAPRRPRTRARSGARPAARIASSTSRSAKRVALEQRAGHVGAAVGGGQPEPAGACVARSTRAPSRPPAPAPTARRRRPAATPAARSFSSSYTSAPVAAARAASTDPSSSRNQR